MNIEMMINALEQQRTEQDALYRSIPAHLGFSNTMFWILYVLFKVKEPCTQQDLCQKSFGAKQTINTAVSGMVKKGLVRLENIPGTRNQKAIVLTEEGKEAIRKYIVPFVRRETAAYETLTEAELECYLNVTSRLNDSLRREIKCYLEDDII